MTWKEVNGNLTLKPGVQCLVLKTGNSEKSIYFASKFDNCAYTFFHIAETLISRFRATIV